MNIAALGIRLFCSCIDAFKIFPTPRFLFSRYPDYLLPHYTFLLGNSKNRRAKQNFSLFVLFFKRMFFKRIFIFIDIKISSVLVQFFGLTAICQQTAKTYVCIRKANEVKTYNSVVSERKCTRSVSKNLHRIEILSPFVCIRQIENLDFSSSWFCPLSPDFTLPNSCVIRYYLKLHRICRQRFRVTLKRTGNTKYVPK